MDSRRNPDPQNFVTPRQAQACRYRCQGHSWREIGRMMGIAPQSAYDLVDRALHNEQAYRKAEVQFTRELELDRLDAMLLVAMTMMEDENRPAKIRLAAIDRALSIGERRSKLLGLDTIVQPADDSFIVDKDRLIREIRERVAANRLKFAAEAVVQLPQESDESTEDDATATPSLNLPEPAAMR
jgi:hypothetical protein